MPTAEYDEESEAYIFTPETLAEFTRFLRKYPDSPTTELIEFFMKNYDGKAVAKEESVGKSPQADRGGLGTWRL